MSKTKSVDIFKDLKNIIGQKLISVHQNPDYSIVLNFETTEFRLHNISGEYLKVKGAYYSSDAQTKKKHSNPNQAS